MAITNPKTGPTNNIGQSIFTIDLTRGKTSLPGSNQYTTWDNHSNDILKGVDVPLGKKYKTPNAHYAYADTTIGAISGFLVNGAPHWGDGSTVNTVWASDNERTTGGNLSYFFPVATVSKAYRDLST